jgi:hypothetical protein
MDKIGFKITSLDLDLDLDLILSAFKITPELVMHAN